MGLHPIRSKHVIDRLHEFLPVDNTAISVIKIAENADFPVLFSHLPEFNLNSDEFFKNIVEVLWDKNDLSNYIPAIQGLFSGSVIQYYLSNQPAFNDSNAHGGLFVISTEMCPFVTFTEFGVSIDTLDKMKEMFPDNEITIGCKTHFFAEGKHNYRTFFHLLPVRFTVKITADKNLKKQVLCRRNF